MPSVRFLAWTAACCWIVTANADEPKSAYFPDPDSGIEYLEEPGWAFDSPDRGSIVLQAEAVLRKLRERGAITREPGVEVTTVAVTDSDPDEPADEGDEHCQFREIPGSRIREWRCYYPSESEEILNRYQLQADIREANAQRERLERQRAEMERYLLSNPELQRRGN